MADATGGHSRAEQCQLANASLASWEVNGNMDPFSPKALMGKRHAGGHEATCAPRYLAPDGTPVVEKVGEGTEHSSLTQRSNVAKQFSLKCGQTPH